MKTSQDLKLMNFLQQFELDSTSIKFSSGLNRPLRILLAFSNLAAPREGRGRKGPEAGGRGRGEAAWGTGEEGEPPPLAARALCCLGFRFGTRFWVTF